MITANPFSPVYMESLSFSERHDNLNLCCYRIFELKGGAVLFDKYYKIHSVNITQEDENLLSYIIQEVIKEYNRFAPIFKLPIMYTSIMYENEMIFNMTCIYQKFCI